MHHRNVTDFNTHVLLPPLLLSSGIAAPFTSRIPSVRAVVDLIRQGRCTLLSALMQQQIMMLESCIAAYTLSALSLHNARSSVSASVDACIAGTVSFLCTNPVISRAEADVPPDQRFYF
jgi:magnesium-transporting ATPase (P-type)